MRKLRKRTDGVGIRRVQDTIKQIYGKYKDELIQQVRIEYNPILLEKNITTFLFLGFKNKSELIDFTKKLSQKTLLTYVYPSYDLNKAMFFFVSSNSETREVISELICEYSTNSTRILWRDRKKINDIWGRRTAKLNCAGLFDPIKCKWLKFKK
jgi:hypothetical protein